MSLPLPNIKNQYKDKLNPFINLDISINTLKSMNNSSHLYNNTYIITNKEIIESEEKMFFNKGYLTDGFMPSIPGGKNYFILNERRMFLKTFDQHNKNRNLVRGDFHAINMHSYIDLYVNGRKIPNKNFLVYSSNAGIDILFESSNLNRYEDNEVVIEYKINALAGFLTDTLQVHNQFTFSLRYNRNTFSQSFLNSMTPRNLLVFQNGNLISPSSGITLINNTAQQEVVVQFNSPLSGEIELVLDRNIIFNFTIKYVLGQERLMYSLGRDFFDISTGSLPKNTCAFYANGLHIDKNKVAQITRFAYSHLYDISITNFVSNFVIYNQSNALEYNPDLYVHGSDYALTKMLGNNRSLVALTNNRTFTIFDNYLNEFSYSETLNENGEKFNAQISTDRYKDYTSSRFLDGLPKIIDKRPYIQRDFLSETTEKIPIRMVPKPEDPLGFSSFFGETRRLGSEQTFFYKVIINSITVFLDDIIVTVVDDTDFITIPNTYFTREMNTLEIVAYDSFTGRLTDLFEVKVGGIDTSQNTSTINGIFAMDNTRQYFSEDIDYSKDVIIMRKIQGNPSSGLFADNTYRGVEGLRYFGPNDPGNEYEIEIRGNTTCFLFKELVLNDLLFINSSYTGFNIRFLVEGSVDQIQQNTIFALYDRLNPNDFPDPITFVKNSTIDVFLNGQHLIKDIDYKIQDNFDYEIFKTTFIIFTKLLRRGDVIQIFSYKSEKITFLSKHVNITNMYGLLYLSGIPIPFSTDYFNLYINERKIYKEDIDLLSDKLIRCRNISFPINSIFLEYNHNSEFLLDDVAFMYKPDKFELVLEKIFQRADPFRDTFDDDAPNVNDVYDSFDPGVDSNNKTPNPFEPPPAVDVDMRSTLFTLWVDSGSTRRWVDPSLPLNNIVASYFNSFGVVGTDIVLNSNNRNLLRRDDFVIGDHSKDPNLIPKLLETTFWFAYHAIMGNTHERFTLREYMEKFLDNKLSNLYDFDNFSLFEIKNGKMVLKTLFDITIN